MCDYSLQSVKSRPAQVGDKLVTKNFGTGSRGFAGTEPGDFDTAVCLLPGTELAFEADIECGMYYEQKRVRPFRTAIFRQVNKEWPLMHHDTIELPDGETMLLTCLAEGQRATVLQLPAAPKTEAEAKEQQRAEFVG